MKKFIFTLFSATLFVACDNSGKTVIPPAETPVNKTVEFTLSPVSDYNQPHYDSASAEVKLSIYKPLYDPYREQILWDTVITKRDLKEYMKLPAPFVIRKTFSILESKEKIGAGYSIAYVTKPFTWPTWFAFGGLAEFGKPTFKVDVHI
jgi:hypothetical protein